jgi:two-component system, response regulator PdtaR
MKNSKPKVLILEDEPLSRLNLAESLRSSGFRVTIAAANSEEAIASMRIDPPDIAVLDIQLEDSLLDGIQTARVIKETLNIPIIFLTGVVDMALVERAKEVRPAYYLFKPSTPLQLDVALDMALENFIKEQEAQPYHSLEGHSAVAEKIYLMKNRIFIKKKGKYNRVYTEDILWIKASNSSTIIETKEEKFVISANLKQFQQQITHPSLVKIHRSHLVNIEHIEAFNEGYVFIRRQEIQEKLAIGQSYREGLDKLFVRLRSGGAEVVE